MEGSEPPPAVQPSLLFLPSEIIEEILLSPFLDVADLCRMRQVSWYLHDIVDRLWTKVAATRWKGWGSVSGSTHREWYTLCRQRCQCEQQLATVLTLISRRCIKVQLTDEDELATVFSAVLETFSHDMLLCVLSEILQSPDKTSNMTNQFYALYGKEYIIRQRLTAEWKKLLELARHEQTMERGAILVAQWMRPCHCPDARAISEQLDSIAEMVAVELLRDREGGDGGGGPDDVKRLRESVLVKVVELHLPVDTVLDAMNEVLYEQLGFRGAGDSYYELDNSYIDRVLEKKKGIPISLCVVYEAVARRLGVRLLPVNIPRHFVLRIHNESEPQPSTSDCVLIDAYNRGQRLSLDQLKVRESLPADLVPTTMEAAEPAVVYSRIVHNITAVAARMDIARKFDEQSAQWLAIPLLSVVYLRLTLTPLAEPFYNIQMCHEVFHICEELLYCPQLAFNTLEKLGPFRGHEDYVTLRARVMTLPQLHTRMEDRRRLHEQATPPQRRPVTTDVKYSIGIIMKHKRYGYCCVIYGWDKECMMDDDWRARMNVDRYPPGRHQPFYNVLAHDGSSRYAAQANLVECPDGELGPIPHWEIGKYFTQFTGTRYIPNDPLRETYPDDP